MYKGIDDYVSKCIRLEPEEQEYFHSLLTHKKIKKKTLLLEAGQVCDFEAYIIKGCVRTYYVDENGFEVDLLFAIEDWWISDLASFSQQKPAQLYIETVEECELLLIDYASKEKLFKKVPAFERLFRQWQTASAKPAQKTGTWPDFLTRLRNIYGTKITGDSQELISELRGDR